MTIKICHHSAPLTFGTQGSHWSQLHIWGLNPLLKVYIKESEVKRGVSLEEHGERSKQGSTTNSGLQAKGTRGLNLTRMCVVEIVCILC